MKISEPPALDARLLQAAAYIQAEVHADIGSDHARLPRYLLNSGRVGRVIVVEKTIAPLQMAGRMLAAHTSSRAELRLGDGFAPIFPGEVDSASLTGLGSRSIVGILERAGDRLPPQLILQPNDSAELLRRWATRAGYHLSAEALAPGFWAYEVLQLVRRPGPDPAYAGLPIELALRYGPHLLRERAPLLSARLSTEMQRLRPYPARLADWRSAEAAWALMQPESGFSHTLS